uniref:RING-type E3 ubiquitin transferase n=1 Tax=Salvator merianae TaxID=96440 RepID=A0A8D0B7D5_SALMN
MSLSSVESRWPEHLAPAKELDNLLRCGICFDYFNIAMIIPQCSHNYCSLCIRKSLSYKAQCPTCCVAATEPDLRNNRILDDLVKTFDSARSHLFQAVMDSSSSPPAALFTKKTSVQCQQKQFLDSFSVKENVHTPRRQFKPPEKESENIKVKQEVSPCDFEKEVETVCKEAGNTSPVGVTKKCETPSTSAAKVVMKVECPVCGVPVQELHINNHLDGCLKRDEKKESLRSAGHKRKLLPKVVYNLLTDRDLRKRLKEYGLSTHGTKQQLIKRHQEFVHMYNSQCDSLNPQSVAEIVKELESNEKIREQLESLNPKKDSMTFTKHQTENEIDEIHRDYRKRHRAEFQLLVDQMNKRRKNTSTIKITDRLELEESRTARVEAGKNKRVGEQTANPSLKRDVLGCGRGQSLDWSALSSTSSLQSSDSSNSSSSDILRDLEFAGECSSSPDNSLGVKMTKQISQHSESSTVQSKSKRRKK